MSRLAEDLALAVAYAARKVDQAARDLALAADLARGIAVDYVRHPRRRGTP